MSTVVLDHTALLAIRRSQHVARAIATAPATGGHLLVPAMCLLAAAAQDPPIADHVGALHNVHIVELGLPGARFAAPVLAAGVAWSHVHAGEVARVSPVQPHGLLVMTADPQVYAPFNIETFTL